MIHAEPANHFVPAPATQESDRLPPVWMYWEGPCPEWIQQCRQTVFANAPEVRLLSADEFDRMRDVDRDIDLSGLHVAHRADYIRAFLLARYGGLWIDSDCAVLKPLAPVLHLLESYDFIAYKERSGHVANNFIGSRRDGKIAAEYYRRVCATLRTREKLGWTSIGSLPLTAILKTTATPWFEVQRERIQPICWTSTLSFFATAGRSEHERNFDDHALCYMLSNVEVGKCQASGRAKDLLAPGTFYRHIIARAIENAGSGRNGVGVALGVARPVTEIFSRMIASYPRDSETVSGPGSTLAQTEDLRKHLPKLIRDLGAKTILDAGCGDFNWLRHVTLDIDRYVGVDVVPDLIARTQADCSTADRSFVCRDIAGQHLPEVDVILCRDTLPLLSYEDVQRVLQNFRRSGSKYLLTTTYEQRSFNHDVVTGNWRPLNLRRPPFCFPEPVSAINENCTEADGLYSDKCLALWRLEDVPQTLTAGVPAHVKPASAGAYDVAVIVPIGLVRGQPGRQRNLEMCLRALQLQNLDRSRYRIIVVEQDAEPRLQSLAAPLADQYIFAVNRGQFNRAWAFNIGACAASDAAGVLCLMDADMLPSYSFLSEGLHAMQAGCRALRPFSRVRYLDAPSTDQAIRDRIHRALESLPEDHYRGATLPDAKGGCTWVDSELYREIGGLDERFRGFGFEDTEFWHRLSRHTRIAVLPGTLIHMHHPRAIDHKASAANERLYRQVAAHRTETWKGPMGNIHRYAQERTGPGSEVYSNRHGLPLDTDMLGVFNHLLNLCSRGGLESLSGPGSSLHETAEIRRRLPALLQDLGARSLLDAPCGDFHWMQHVDLNVEQYWGVDLLPANIERHQQNFSGNGRTFLCLDITRDPLPKADVIFSRDCLVHHAYKDIFRALENFKASGATYLLTTTYENRKVNEDIATGDWRPLNFRRSPFNFPEPLLVVDEHCTENRGRYADKALALWPLADLL